MQLPPPVHGVTVMNQTVARSEVLAEHFDIDVLPLRFAESVEQLRQPSVRKLWRAARTGVALVATLARTRPDLAYFTLAPSGPAFYRDCAYVAVLKLFGVARIYHLHAAGIAEHARTSVGRALNRWIFDDAWVLHLSPALRADTSGLVPDERVAYVPNGLADRAGPAPFSHRDVPRILFLSNIIRSKGPLVLLDSLVELSRRGIAFEATFAGAPFHDGCADELQRRIRTEALDDRVRYIGPAYGDAKDALLRTHDVFVLPTEQDAFPMVLLEAMQAGLPVVTTAVGAIPEIVAEDETGFVVPAGDASAVAQRLELLLADAELRRRLGECGRARFEERYTSRRFEQNLAAALERCLQAFAA
jgi:glycosyltransferase involved in cell wall biosynthesis